MATERFVVVLPTDMKEAELLTLGRVAHAVVPFRGHWVVVEEAEDLGDGTTRFTLLETAYGCRPK